MQKIPKTVLQIPVSKQLRDDAEKAALEYGFSSLQEILQKFTKKLAHRKVNVFQLDKDEKVIYLSKKSAKRYSKAMEDLKAGKNTYKAKDVDDFLDQMSKL